MNEITTIARKPWIQDGRQQGFEVVQCACHKGGKRQIVGRNRGQFVSCGDGGIISMNGIEQVIMTTDGPVLVSHAQQFHILGQ